MIGNDIIDRIHARQQSNIYHPRWAEKVLVPSEKEQLSLFPNIELALWTFWALKESAYKIFFRKTAKRLFIPKIFLCSIQAFQANQLEANVLSPFGNWHGEVSITPESIHAVVATDRDLFPRIIRQKIFFSHPTVACQSQETRQALLQSLGDHCQLPCQHIQIKKPRQFPEVFSKNKALPIDVSMSHHHQWGAFAFLQAHI